MDCGRTLKRRNKRRILGEKEAGGGEKTDRVGDVVASKAGDSRFTSQSNFLLFKILKCPNELYCRPSSDAPDCSVSVFKLPATGVQAVK